MKERIEKAYSFADKLCYEVSGGRLDIPEEDQVVLEKYMKANYIQLVKHKILYQDMIYFPTLQADEFEGLTGYIWLRIIRHAMTNHGICSKIGPNSITEYVGKPWEYFIHDLKVIKNKDASKIQKDEEVIAWKEIVEREADES